MQQADQLAQHLAEVRGIGAGPLDLGQEPGPVGSGQGLHQAESQVGAHGAEHGPHIGLRHPARPVGDGLVEEAQAIAHTAIRRPCQECEGPGLEGQALGLQDETQSLTNLLGQQPPQIELKTARQDRHRHLLGIGSGEQELHMGRRLLQGLQQGVEAVVGEHVHLVDEVHLVTTAGRGIGDVVQQFPGLIHLGARGRIDLQQVDEPARVDLTAGGADPAGSGTHALFAVQGLGQDAGQGRLADPTGPGEEVGVVQLVPVQGVAERTHHVLLPHHVGKRLGAPFTGEHLIGHARQWPGMG